MHKIIALVEVKDTLKVPEPKVNKEEQKSDTKRKLSDQKFKTPNKRKMSGGSSSISSISEQEDDNENEFNELWTDIKIKSNNYSDAKGN